MMRNVKKVIQLIKYGHQVTLNIVLGFGFLVFGLFAKVTGITSIGIDLLFPLMLPIFLCQILYGLDYVKMISSADMKRWMTVYVPDLLVDVSVLIVLALYYVLTELRPYYPDQLILNNDMYDGIVSVPTGNIMFCAGGLAFVLMCYVAGCYKYYWAFTAIFMVSMMAYGIASTWILNPFGEVTWHLTKGQGILAAFLFYMAGVVVGGAIRRLLYKVPVSSMAIGKRLSMEGKA
jgi:hypothetical protein